MEINQYCVVLVNLDPTIGSEVNKTRPCLVISPNEMNKHLKTLVVAPMTTVDKNYPTRVKIISQNKVGWVALDQIRTIDKSRIIKSFNIITNLEIIKIKKTIEEIFVS